MQVVSFDNLIDKVFDKVENALQKRDFAQARYWYDKGCNLYNQYPTENRFIEARKDDLHRTLYER